MQRPKLILDLDALTVESFDPDARGGGASGTVFGNDITRPGVACSLETQESDCECFTVGCTNVTICGQATCTCPPPPASDFFTCGLTFCDDTCNRCYSLITDAPERC